MHVTQRIGNLALLCSLLLCALSLPVKIAAQNFSEIAPSPQQVAWQ
jgi:hypothetical protein